MKQKRTRSSVFTLLCLIFSIFVATISLCGFVLPNNRISKDSETAPSSESAVLLESADFGMEYINRMIFFGESTTTHLRARGVLTGGTKTHQVWADESGTKTLSSKLLSETLIYPLTGESLTISAALEKEQPAYLVLSFGLNNISYFINNQENYATNYNKLIDAVEKASPNTKIILQSIYPISASCDAFSVDGTTICAYIKTLNDCLKEIAAIHENVRFVDTASVLKASDGTLLSKYDSGDGVHLNTDAYREILLYLRTHAWKE